MKKALKVIYQHLPFKRLVFTLLKKLWSPPENIYRHLHFVGAFTAQLGDGRSFQIYHPGYQIENEIFWNGLLQGWEKESLNIWKRLSARSQTILDIGANTGIYALVAKAVNNASQVFAFEPHPLFFNLLQKNDALNDFHITCVPKAVSDKDGTVVLEDYTGSVATLTFQCCTLDSFIKANGIQSIDLIKIDVETHEPQVLAGFVEHLTIFKPSILIEILNEDIGNRIWEMVHPLGYLYFNIDERGTVRQTTKIEKSDYYNYLICTELKAKEIGLL